MAGVLVLGVALVSLLCLPLGAFCLIYGRPPKGYAVLRRIAGSNSALRRLGVILIVAAAISLAVIYRSIRLIG